jgi:hypothetical protein
VGEINGGRRKRQEGSGRRNERNGGRGVAGEMILYV